MLHTLEQNKSFPYIAWTAIAAFCCLTFMLVVRLEAEMSALVENDQDNYGVIYESL